MLNRKELLNLIFVVVLLLGIPFAVLLIRQQQILRSRATVNPIVFTGSNVKSIADSTGAQKLIATAQNVELQLTSTLDQLLPSPSATAVPTTAPTTAPTATPASNTCSSIGGSCANSEGRTANGASCSNYRADQSGGCVNPYPYCYTSCSTAPTATPASNTCSSIGGSCANSEGRTAGGQSCSTYRANLSGDCANPYPYCYTSCSAALTVTPAPITRSPSATIWPGESGVKSTISDNEDLVINFNRNTDVNVINLRIDGVEEGGSTQVAVPLTGGATQITWPNTHAKHTVGSHNVSIHPYYCPNGPSQPGCVGGGIDARSVNVTN